MGRASTKRVKNVICVHRFVRVVVIHCRVVRVCLPTILDNLNVYNSVQLLNTKTTEHAVPAIPSVSPALDHLSPTVSPANKTPSCTTTPVSQPALPPPIPKQTFARTAPQPAPPAPHTLPALLVPLLSFSLSTADAPINALPTNTPMPSENAKPAHFPASHAPPPPTVLVAYKVLSSLKTSVSLFPKAVTLDITSSMVFANLVLPHAKNALGPVHNAQHANSVHILP